MIKVNDQFRFANRVRQGDYLQYYGNKVKVQKVEIVDAVGIYSILTESGMIEVNGVLVSCYSNFENHHAI